MVVIPDKPLRWEVSSALQFSDPDTVSDYQARDAYTPDSFALLRRLMVNGSVLDVGCGTGDVTIPLSGMAEKIDGVDISKAMLSVARTRPGGRNTNIRWLLGRVEELSLPGGYGLVTAGDSIHWMDWKEFFPALRPLMTQNALLVIMERFKGDSPWSQEKKRITAEYYTEPDGGAYDVVRELQIRGYFQQEASVITAPIRVFKTVDDFLAETHSRNGCTRMRLGPQKTKELDQRLVGLIKPYLDENGLISYLVHTKMRWGVVLPTRDEADV